MYIYDYNPHNYDIVKKIAKIENLNIKNIKNAILKRQI